MFRKLYEAAENGDSEGAERLQNATDELARVYQGPRSLSESLAALKVIMSELGFCQPFVLPPLLESSDEEKEQIRGEMKQLAIHTLAFSQ
jgi:4-hydroxy-tetrahydrodipicolinate synthase